MTRQFQGGQGIAGAALSGSGSALTGATGLSVAERRVGIRVLLACIRYRDVIVLQGSPLMGAAFSIRTVTGATIAELLIFALASVLLVSHIFSFNDWAGAAEDRNDPNKSHEVFSARGVTRWEILVLSMVLLASSLVLFALLPRRTLLLAIAIAGLGMFYSHPHLNGKAIPVVSSWPHLVGGGLHFLLGYSLWSPVDESGVLIALFFALTFTAGHLNQEVRDCDGDRVNGIRTNAVAFGKKAAFLAGFAGFTLAYADLFWLARMGVVPAALALAPLALYPVHVLLSAQTLRAGLSFENVSRFQRRYRLLYGIIGIAIGVALLLRGRAG